jgi:hypothetical protein
MARQRLSGGNEGGAMKLGFNEATCMRNSTLAQDIVLAETYGYDYIELRLDMLKAWLREHSLDELAEFFAASRLKPWGYNSLEDITFCDTEGWKEKQAELAFACKASAAVGGDCLVVVPTIKAGQRWTTRATVKDSVKRLREMADVAVSKGCGWPSSRLAPPSAAYAVLIWQWRSLIPWPVKMSGWWLMRLISISTISGAIFQRCARSR